MSKKVLVLGANGMIGQAVFRELDLQGLDVMGTSRNPENARGMLKNKSLKFEAETANEESLKKLLSEFDVVVNTLGLIKQKIDEKNNSSRKSAIKLNSLLPTLVATAIAGSSTQVIQIATDCVFTGKTGNYDESSPHDAYDIYGKSKSLGEVSAPNFLNLRCSVVGPEQNSGKGLLNWVITQKEGEKIKGYLNHNWNGITSKTFAQIVTSEVTSRNIESGTFHIVPTGQVSKAELVKLIAEKFNRRDLIIENIDAAESVDRTLVTKYPEINQKFWKNAGFSEIPTVPEMISLIV